MWVSKARPKIPNADDTAPEPLQQRTVWGAYMCPLHQFSAQHNHLHNRAWSKSSSRSPPIFRLPPLKETVSWLGMLILLTLRTPITCNARAPFC